jgi:hypothetical protein
MAGEKNVTLFPLVGWEFASLPGGNVMFAVHYLPGTPAKPLTRDQARQLADVHRFGMTAKQCDELAKTLQRAAAQSRKRQQGGGR